MGADSSFGSEGGCGGDGDGCGGGAGVTGGGADGDVVGLESIGSSVERCSTGVS